MNMNKILPLLLLTVLFTGCTITKVQVGDKKFATYRFLDWTQIGKIDVEYPPAGGTNNITITINDYQSDREKALKDMPAIIDAAVQAAIKGAAKSIVPLP